MKFPKFSKIIRLDDEESDIGNNVCKKKRNFEAVDQKELSEIK